MGTDDLFRRFGREFPRGTVLFREGEPGGEMYVVHQGKVAISKRAGGAEKVLTTLGQGQFLGEMSILNHAPRSATATCVEDSKLLVVDARTFEAMIRGNTEVALRMIRTLAARLAEADRQIENLLLRDARSRIVHFLAATAERDAEGGGARLELSEGDLAVRLGIEAATVRGVLESLEKARLVELRDGALVVPEPGRLRHFLDFLELQSGAEGET
ncbi:MAG TPA: Crp/Fnr family transcriptional regulator [Anaeromyxobacteraceae bacterium]|nr:Crp/Fnr family transcriptional regulator [Anaeromyxobacteraceae bacterium]